MIIRSGVVINGSVRVKFGEIWIEDNVKVSGGLSVGRGIINIGNGGTFNNVLVTSGAFYSGDDNSFNGISVASSGNLYLGSNNELKGNLEAKNTIVYAGKDNKIGGSVVTKHYLPAGYNLIRGDVVDSQAQ